MGWARRTGDGSLGGPALQLSRPAAGVQEKFLTRGGLLALAVPVVPVGMPIESIIWLK